MFNCFLHNWYWKNEPCPGCATTALLSNNTAIATPLPIQEGEDELLANNGKPEYIICAAIHFNDGNKHEHQPKNIMSGFVVCGRRHHNCFAIVSLINNGVKHEAIQGFLTSKGTFVSRKNAGRIAFEQKQISEPTDCLFSEDLY